MPSPLRWISLFLLFTIAIAANAQDKVAGAVKALIPDASRNAQPTKVNDTLNWDDLLQTNAQGRLRASLTAGSILSLGSSSELRVVQHDAASQQTLLVMNYGKLRNQVAKITKADGKFEVRTPNAVVGVTGTDFYVGYLDNQTTVICYSGTVAVTPANGAKVVRNENGSRESGGVIIVDAGQMVVIGSETPPGGYVAMATPTLIATAGMQDTEIVGEPVTVAKKRRRRRLMAIWFPVAAGGVGAGVGIAESLTGNTNKPATPPPTTEVINLTNQFGTVNATDAGMASKESELQSYNTIQAPKGRSLGSVNFTVGAFTGSNILSGGTFANTGSSFVVNSGAANYGQPPKGNIFSGTFTGPATWTLVSQKGKYTDNFTLTGPVAGTLYTGASVTGTTTQNITLYTNQWVKDHEGLITLGKSQLTVTEGPMESVDRRLNALNRKSTRHKLVGWSFVW